MTIRETASGICSLLLAEAGPNIPATHAVRLSRSETATALLWLTVILIVLLVAIVAIGRFSHRFRQTMFPRPNPPTESDDVWQMHRLPPDPDERLRDDE